MAPDSRFPNTQVERPTQVDRRKLEGSERREQSPRPARNRRITVEPFADASPAGPQLPWGPGATPDGDLGSPVEEAEPL